MKKKALVYISTACIIVGCTSINTIAQPNVRVVSPYNTNLVISPSNDTKQPMSAFSSISGFDQRFSNLDPGAKNIKRLNITSAKIESSDPSKKNIGMFKSLKMYI